VRRVAGAVARWVGGYETADPAWIAVSIAASAGVFGSTRLYDLPVSPLNECGVVLVADVNGDGWLDVVVMWITNAGASSQETLVAILGDGTARPT
jgi:hypothetical protein